MQDLYEIFECLLLWYFFFDFEICVKVSLIAILEDEVDIVGSLFDIDKLNDVIVLAGFQNLDFVF